jgi:hypothetical protein
MSATPHLIRSLRWGQKFGNALTTDAMVLGHL